MRNRVRELRTEHGYQQELLCQQLHISRQTLSAIENCRWTPSLGLALAIARFFELPVEQVFIDDNRPAAADRPADASAGGV